jgi:8-oxo-dGTP diphosphatase
MQKDTKITRVTSCGTCPFHRQKDGGFEILLVKPRRHHPQWGIPKGHISQGETIEECAIRETLEETGYVALLGKRLPDISVRHGQEVKTVKSFLASIDDEIPRDSRDGENVAVEWFDIDDLPQLHRYQESLIEYVVEVLKASS